MKLSMLWGATSCGAKIEHLTTQISPMATANPTRPSDPLVSPCMCVCRDSSITMNRVILVLFLCVCVLGYISSVDGVPARGKQPANRSSEESGEMEQSNSRERAMARKGPGKRQKGQSSKESGEMKMKRPRPPPRRRNKNRNKNRSMTTTTTTSTTTVSPATNPSSTASVSQSTTTTPAATRAATSTTPYFHNSGIYDFSYEYINKLVFYNAFKHYPRTINDPYDYYVQHNHNGEFDHFYHIQLFFYHRPGPTVATDPSWSRRLSNHQSTVAPIDGQKG
uniref:Uncharacterized protein n=1 Tax=Anopheles melas TaxID=34690 RepID=A0A182UFY8_9DIPT